MRFDYDRQGSFVLSHTSIQLARGEQDRFPMMRAEWDCRTPESSSIIHSQPHWHVYPARLLDTPISDKVDIQYARVQEHLHLAMCARWHALEGSSRHHAIVEKPDDLIKWFESLLSYLHEQITYALGRVDLDAETASRSLF